MWRERLMQRLEIVLEWYRGMIDARTQRLAYRYDPIRDRIVVDGSPIRDIASVWDVAVLSNYLSRSDLHSLIEHSLAYYTDMLVRHDRALILASDRLGESSTIAHSAFLALALLAWPTHRLEPAGLLVDGILAQQREDGSYAISFSGEPDTGAELYPAEAMLALLEAYERRHDERYVASVERAFDYYRTQVVAPDYAVFHANWQAQYGVRLHEVSRTHREAIRAHVLGLHDQIIEQDFYERIESRPERQATVEVACALEGICDALAIAMREHDHARVETYARCASIALGFLLHAQRLEHATRRERGGFGNSLADRTQRIDVTGHAMTGFIKSLQRGVAEP